MSVPAKRVQVLFSEAEIERLRAIAESEGKTLPALIRAAVRETYLEQNRQERLRAVGLLAEMNLPTADWEQMEREAVAE